MCSVLVRQMSASSVGISSQHSASLLQQSQNGTQDKDMLGWVRRIHHFVLFDHSLVEPIASWWASTVGLDL